MQRLKFQLIQPIPEISHNKIMIAVYRILEEDYEHSKDHDVSINDTLLCRCIIKSQYLEQFHSFQKEMKVLTNTTVDITSPVQNEASAMLGIVKLTSARLLSS